MLVKELNNSFSKLFSRTHQLFSILNTKQTEVNLRYTTSYNTEPYKILKQEYLEGSA